MYCSKRCRQSAWRLRRRAGRLVATDRPIRVAYADPPYPGTAREVDHLELLERLTGGAFDGWALSTSHDGARLLWHRTPPGTRLCPWVKPHGASSRTYGLHNCWEALLVWGGRQERPGKRDWLCAHPARGEGMLPGRKPSAFCAWLFQCLGLRPGDDLVDLYPGTGIVSRAWANLSSLHPGDDSH